MSERFLYISERKNDNTYILHIITISNPNTKGKEYRQILILQGLSNRLRKQWYEQYYTKGMGFTPKYQITFKNDIKYEDYSTSKEYQDVYSFLSQNEIDYKNKKLSYLNSIIER